MSFEYPEIELNEEQEADAALIEDILRAKAQAEVRYVARLLASKADRDLLGETEFRVRDSVHRLGAAGIDAALAERKKRGTKDRAVSARTAGKTRSSNVTRRSRSPR